MNQIIAVEFVDRSAFQKENLGQIITRNSKGLVEIIYFKSKVIPVYIIKTVGSRTKLHQQFLN
jgi:hypothetical protein